MTGPGGTWRRPVPVIGDPSAASERAGDPAGWALGPGVRAGLTTALAARRDVRRYRPDPIPPELLDEVLTAGHQAPSVGHSQPWRFIVVRQAATRDRAVLLSDRERLRQAEQLTPDRRARLLDLQLEGIREAPVGIVVACDRRTPAAGVLGRASFGDADLWSCACAIENMWLAARAAGLGMGWVTLFQPAELAELLHLPPGVETLGWLCLGWPDERPPEPGLQRAGWSERLPLDQVVMAERWPEDDQAPPPSYLAPHDESGQQVNAPAAGAVVGARDSGDRLLTAPGSLGVLDTAVNRVLALGQGELSGGTLTLVFGRHPVTALGVSAYPDSVSTDVYAATEAGESLAAVTAAATGLAVRAIWATARSKQGDLVRTDALARDDTARLLAEGTELGRSLATDGLVCLGEVGVGNTTVAAALTGVLLNLPAGEVVGLGVGADAAMLQCKREVVGAAIARARATYGDGLNEPITLLSALGGPEFAMLTGVVLGAASAGAAVVLDGLATSAAAVLAVRQQPGVQAHLVAGQRSRERAHGLVLTELGLEPLLELRLRSGEGVGACLGAQLLLAGLRMRRTAGRVTH